MYFSFYMMGKNECGKRIHKVRVGGGLPCFKCKCKIDAPLNTLKITFKSNSGKGVFKLFGSEDLISEG